MPRKGPVIDIGLRIQDVSKVVGDLENKVSKVKTLGLDKAARNDIENIEKMLADFQKQIDNLGHSKVNTTTFSKSQQAVIDKVNELESRTSALEVGMKTLIDTMAKADGGKFATQMKDLADTMEALSHATSNAITAISAMADVPEVTEETLQLKEMAAAINEVKQAFDKEPKVKKFKTEEDAIKSILKEYDKYMDTMDKLIDLKDSGIDSKDKEKQLLTLQKSLYETGDKIDAMMAKAVDSFGDSFYKNKDSYGVSFQSMSDAIMREMDDIEADIEKKVKEIQRKLPDAFEEINKEPVNVTVNPVVPKKAGKSIQKQVDAVADDTTVTVSNVEVEPEAAKEAVEAVSDAVQDSTSDIKDTLQEVVQDATEAANAVSEIVDEKEISDEVSQLKEMAMAIKDVQDAIYKKQKADKFESDEEAFEAVIEEYSKYQDIMDEIYELQENGIDTKEQEKQLLSLQKTAVETGNKIDVMMDEAAQAFGPDFYSHKDSFGASFEKISEDVISQDLYEIQNEIEAKAEQIAKDLSAALPDDMLESFADGIESASSGMGSVLDSTLKSLGVQAADSVEPEMKNVGAELAQSVSEGILSQEETIKNSWVKVFHGVKGAQDNAHFVGSTTGPKQFFTDNKGLALNYAGSYGSADTAFLDTSKFFNLPGYGNKWDELVYLGDGLSEESKTAIELYKKLIDDLHALENITDDKLGFEKKNGFITAFIDNTTGEIVAGLDSGADKFYKSIKSQAFVSKLEKGFDDLSGETKVIFDKFIDDLKAYQDHLYDLNGKLFSGEEIGNKTKTDDYALKLNKTKEYTGLYASNIYDPPSGYGKHDLNSEWIMFEKDANEVVKAAWAIKGATETYNNFEKAFNDILGKITSTKMGKINKEIVEKSKLLNDLNKDKSANSATFDQDQLMEDTATELEDLVTQKMVLQNKIDNIADYIQQLNSQAKAQGYKKGLNDILKNMDDIEDLPDEMKQLFALSGLVDKVGNSTLKKIDIGHSNMGVYQNDEFTIIEREAHKYTDKIDQLIPKLHKAAQEGISVGEIYGKVVDAEKNIVYEIQSTVQGKNIAESNDYLEATDDQIQKLYDDIEKLNKIGLFVDVGGDNINYDKETGFSFVDMMAHVTEQNKAYTASTAKETIDRYFKNLNEEFYNRIYETVDQLNPNKTKEPGSVVYDKAKAKELYKEYKTLKEQFESLPDDVDDDTFNDLSSRLFGKTKEIKEVYAEIKEIYEDWESLYNDGLASWDDVDKASDNLAAYEHLMHKIGESTDETSASTENLSDEVKNAISNYTKFKGIAEQTEIDVMNGNAMDEELDHAEANLKHAEKALAKLGYVFDETSGKIVKDFDKAALSLSEVDLIDDVPTLIEKFYELQKAQEEALNQGDTYGSKQYLSTLNEIGNKLDDLGYEYNGLSNVWEEAPKFFEEPELSEDNAIELFKKYKELKDEYNSLPKDAGVDKLKEASDKCMAVEADMKTAYEAAKKNFDDMSDLYSTGAIPLSDLENAEKTLFAYEVGLKKIGVNIGSIGDISEEAGESVSDFAQSVKEAAYEDEDIENLLEAWEHYNSIAQKQLGKWDSEDYDQEAVDKALELGDALVSLGYKYDKTKKMWQEPIETKEALDQAEKLIDSKTTDADALIETYQKLSDIQKNMHPNETVFDYVTIADSVLVAIDNVAVSLANLGYTWDDLNKQWTKSADTVEDVSENLGEGFVSIDSLMEKAVNAMDEAIEEGSKLADKLEELADESEFMSIKEYYSVDNLLKGDNSAENINKVIDELWATYDKLESSGMIEASDEGRYIDEAVDKLKAYAKELGYFNDTLWNRFVDISPEKLLNGDYTLDNFKKIWSEMTDTYADAPENITEVMDAQFRALIEKGKELGFTLQDIGGHLNFAPAITESVEESTEKISEEAQDFIEVSEKAEQAAMSKEEFAAANAEVLKSIIESLNGLENEGEAFANLNKLLNNLGGTKGSEKLEKTKEGIAAIIELLSRPVDDSAFITALQKIAESGSNLGDIAAILKASKKDLLEAKKVFDEINTEDIDNLMKYHAQDIMKNAKKELMALGGNGTQIINISELNKTKDGLIEVVGLIRTADDTLQEFTLHTKDGIHMQNVGMTENTAKIAKQMKVYAQVQQFFDKMQAQGKSVTDGAFFDKNADPDIWQMLIDYAKDYHEELGNILSITTQVRQASNGDLLQSFSINGENGHLTVGPEGETVASNQQLLNVEELEKRIKALSQTTKKYHTLLMEQGTEGWTDAHAQELKKIEDEYADIVRLVKEYSDILGDSTDITEVFEAAVNKMTVDFNNTEQTYIDKVKKSLDDALNNPNNKNQEFTESFNEELRLAIQNVNELQELINSHGESKAPWSEDEITKIKELHSNIDGTVLSIKDLENILAKSVSVDKLLTKINNDLKDNSAMPKELKARYIELRNEIDKARKSLDGLNKVDYSRLEAQFQSLHQEMVRVGKTGKSMVEQISQAIRSQSVQFIAKYFSLQDVIRYTRTLAQNVINIDTAITELRKVSDASNERLQQSFEKSSESAQELGQTIQHIVNVTADWSRLGYDVDAAEDLARVTALFTSVGDNMSADDASSYLISTLQGFQMAADEAETIVDKYNMVANNFAIDTRGIGEALQRSAASFNAANTELSKSIALVTAANEVVQNPEVVGTMFKTLSARIRGATTELQDLGEEEDEFTQSTSKLQKLVKGLTGFDIMVDKNTFKDVYEILLGIGKEWDKLTDVERASLGEALAGKRNSNALYAVLGNLDTLEEAYQAAEHSAGSAAREQENYAQSIQYSIDRAKASIEEVSYDLLDSGLVKGIVELANDALQFLDRIIEKADSLPGIIAGIGAAIATIKLGGNINADSITAFENSLKETSTYINNFNTAMKSGLPISEDFIEQMGIADVKLKAHLIKSLKTGKTSLLEFKAAELAATLQTVALEAVLSAVKGLIVMGVSLAVSALVTKVTELAEAEEKAQKASLSAANALEESQQNLEAQISKYEELQKKMHDASTTEDEIRTIKADLVGIQKELNDKYSEEARKLDLVNGKLEDQLALLKNISTQEALNYTNLNRKEYENARNRIEDTFLGSLTGIGKEDEAFTRLAEKYGFKINRGSGMQLVANFRLEAGSAEETLTKFSNDLYELEKATGKDYTDVLNRVSDYINRLQNDEKLQGAISLVDKYTAALIRGSDEWQTAYNDAKEAVDNYNEALATGEGIDTAERKLEKARAVIEAFDFKEDESYVKAAFEAIFDGLNEEYQKAYNVEQQLKKSLEEGTDYISYSLGKLKALNLKESDFVAGIDGFDSMTRAYIHTILSLLGLTMDDLDLLVEKLVEVGVVEGDIAETSDEAFGGSALKSYIKTLNEVSEASMKGTELTTEQLAALRKPFEELGKQFPQLKDDFTVLNEEFLQGTDLWADALANVKNAVLGLKLDELGEDFEKAADEFSLPLKIDNEEKVRLLNELKELGKGGHVDLTVRPVIPTDWLNELGWDAGEGAATIFTSTYANKAGNIAMNFTPIITDENGNYVAALTPDELQEYAEGVIAGVHADYLKLKIGATFTGDDALQQAEAAAEKIHQFHEKYFLNKTYEIPLEISEEGFEEFKTDLDNYIEADKSITIQINADISDNISTISDKLGDINTAAALVAKNFKVSFSDLEGLSSVFPGILEGMTILKDGSVQLNKEVAQSVISAVQAEADADAQSVMDRLNLQATLLESKAKTYKEMAEAASVLAGNEVDSEMTATEARTKINAGLAEIEQINSKLTANEVNKQQKSVADSAYENGEQTQKNWEAAAQGSEEAMYNFATAANEYQTAVAEHRAIKRMGVSNTTYSGSTGTYNETDLLAETKSALESDAELQNQMYEELRERYLEAAAVAEKAASTARDGISMIQATRKFAKYNLDQVSQGKAGSTKPESMEGKKDEYKQVIDYFERMVKVIDNSISILEAHLEDVTGAFAKNSLLSAEEDLIQSKLDGYSAAVDMYSGKAEEALAKIPKDIADKLINGAVDIDTFIDQSDDEVVKAISDYQSWADKVQDARLQLVQLKETLRQLELQKFQNIMKDFTDQIDLRQSSGIDLISKQIDLLKEAGELVGESFYQQQKELTEKNLRAFEEEREALVNQLNEALSRGVDVGSDEWIEMEKALIDVEAKILDAKKALEEFDNALLALHTEIFNRIQDQFSMYQSELSNMEALFDDESMKVADDNGDWTKEGLARLGLLAQQYELAQEQVRMYGEEIEKLNQDYLDGKYSTTEYMEKLSQLKQEQWSAVNASEEAKKAMIALNKARVEIVIEGIEKEIDAYAELIEKQKELLSAEKDLHDYQKSIAESEKDIVALQKQLAAIAGDDSAAARAKRFKLEEQLADKQAELEEKQYDHSIDQQQDALDKQLEQYKETRQLEIEELQNSLLEIEKMLTDAFEAVRENSETIGNEIIEKAREHGIEMSECLTDAWFQGEDAIARYGETLTSETSNFISGIQEVENNIWGLQDQANATADDLANMLATRADNLVDELVRSYDSEANLDAMTNALHDSLSSTIDGSYAGTSAKNALAGITDAADELADSAERARRALLDLLEAETKTPKWEIYDRHGNLITTTDDPDEARKFADDPTVIVKRVGGYASGSKRIVQNEVAWTQEKGAEMIISPSSGAILTPLKKNDAVIPADMTSNLWEWGRFNPEEFAEKLLSAGKVSGAGTVTTNTMQVGSLVTVNGNVNDSIEMMKIASQQATAKIKQSWNDFSNTIRG